MFSKIKNRCSLHPNAVYSFLQTYGGNNATRNIKIALMGYQMAFQEIKNDNKPLIDVTVSGNMPSGQFTTYKQSQQKCRSTTWKKIS